MAAAREPVAAEGGLLRGPASGAAGQREGATGHRSLAGGAGGQAGGQAELEAEVEKVKGEQEKQTKLLKRKRFAALEKTHRGASHSGAGPRVGMAVNQSSQSVGKFLILS